MDWSRCADVESKAGVISGAWVVKGTRVPADAIIDNAKDGYSIEMIVADMFPTVPLARARSVLEFAARREAHPAR